MIGAGGMAESWIGWWTEQFGDRVRIEGLVEVNPEVLRYRGNSLGLDKGRLFTDADVAIDSVDCDFVGIATPPEFHSLAAVKALEKGLPVICEKPIASTVDEAKAMFRAARASSAPCVIIQNYRYAPDIQELVRIREEGRLGRLQHIVGRYACDYRKEEEWRHDRNLGLFFEGAVHHFDMLRFLAGGDCEILSGFGWNPDWSSFPDVSSGLFILRMDNGVHACYEGNNTAAGLTNCWHREHYRAEFEEGTVEVSGGTKIAIHRNGREAEVYDAPDMALEGHEYLFAEFLDWLDGGPPSETRIEDNIRSFAMTIAALEACVDGETKRVGDYLADIGT